MATRPWKTELRGGAMHRLRHLRCEEAGCAAPLEHRGAVLCALDGM